MMVPSVWKAVERLRVLRRLGPIQACKLSVSSRRRSSFRIRAKGHTKPFILRGRTSDRWVFEQVVVSQQYASIPRTTIPRTIVDAGANAGYATRYFKRRWPASQIVAIEPDEDNARVAAENFEGLEGVTLLRAGLWSREGQASFVAAGDSKYALRLRADEAGPVSTVTIPSVMERMGWDRIDLLKMDIEGGELEVFAEGARDWISRVGTLVIELHENVAPGCTTRLFEALYGRTFTLKWKGEDLLVFPHPDIELAGDG